jgi:succinate dehydrogenase / fumarate reductase, cytochrome b subunit
MWTWILHRLTGLGILLFLIIHVVETGLIIYSPEFYDSALVLYKNPLFRFAELAIFFAVLFHAVNGLRIVIQDFWPT